MYATHPHVCRSIRVGRCATTYMYIGQGACVCVYTCCTYSFAHVPICSCKNNGNFMYMRMDAYCTCI